MIVLRVAFFEAVGTHSTSSVSYQTTVLARFASILSSQKQKTWANEEVINGDSSSLVPGLPSAGELQAVVNLRAVSFGKYPNWVALEGVAKFAIANNQHGGVFS